MGKKNMKFKKYFMQRLRKYIADRKDASYENMEMYEVNDVDPVLNEARAIINACDIIANELAAIEQRIKNPNKAMVSPLGISYSLIKRNLMKAKKAKKEHKKDCKTSSCTRCHFYSGSISSLSKLLGEPGIID